MQFLNMKAQKMTKNDKKRGFVVSFRRCKL